jgi:hypothetical protein
VNFSDIFPSWDFGRKLVSSRYIECLYNNFGWYYSLATSRTVVRWGKTKEKKNCPGRSMGCSNKSGEMQREVRYQPARKLEPFQSFSSLSGFTHVPINWFSLDTYFVFYLESIRVHASILLLERWSFIFLF